MFSIKYVNKINVLLVKVQISYHFFFQCMFILLHYLKGTPFRTSDQGKSRRLTHWEQIDQGTQFTDTRKFLTFVPIVL